MKQFLKILSYVAVALLSAWLVFVILLTNNVIQRHRQPKLARLESLIEQRFIGDADITAVEDAAAYAMIDALNDRWSHYIPADQYGQYLDRVANTSSGVGITITVDQETNQVIIMKVTPGSPASDAGLLPDDILVEADGTDLTPLSADEIGTLVKGEEGTTVALTVLRKGERLTFDVERRTFDTPVATASMLPDRIGLIVIENFDARCSEETLRAIQELLDQGAQSLIFDLRNNPGGYKDELVKVLDYLLPEGDLFISEDYTGKVNADRSDPDHLDIPMAVLVNENSYSAAEFFAAALRDYDAAIIVGEQTCGKGYFQSTFPLGDGSAVGLSIGRYYTPNHVSLADVGITPDIVVPVTEEENRLIYFGRIDPDKDPQLTAAIEALKAN